jgi:methionyl-tRNA formyltransferase
MGVLGFHPTKLPQNRGRHPIIWSLALGLNETASSFFFMNEGADDGDILSQEVVTIEYHDNAKTLYQKIIDTALKQIEIFLPLLQNNTFTTIPQDNIKSNIWRKRSIKDGMIDFRMSSKSIYNLVRALTKPYVGAHIIYQNTNIPIWEVEEVVYNNANIEPGKILSINQETILVKTSDGAIRLLEHQFTNLPEIGDYL